MEINIATLFITLCMLIAACADVDCEEPSSSYIFTSPRSLKVGSNNQLQILRFGDLRAGYVKVKLYYKENYDGNETLASENKYQLEKGKRETLINYFVEPFSSENVYDGRIQINGSIGGQTIGGSDQVSFSTVKKNIIIIQTDKPLYKPGENVRWRVLKVNSKLKPSLKEDDVGLLYVEDPNGIRLFQFENVSLKNGLYESQFPLADEPVLGDWKLTLTTKNDTTSTTFNVKQYVLPKFEVKIKFPPFVLATEKLIPIQVCANYTYGKPVTAQLNLNVSFPQYDYYPASNNGPVLQESIELDGCYTYTLNVSLIQKSSPDYYSNIVVVANVIEEGTGVQMNDTQYLRRTTVPLNLNLNADQHQRQYFKPGLPYNGKLKVTNPDNTPAAGEWIELAYTVHKERVIADYLGTKEVKYSKNFTTDANGIIQYTIPPQNQDTMSIQVEARSVTYTNNPNDPEHVLNQPQTSSFLSAFYSPSGSFIQLASVEKTISCDTKKHFKLLYTAKYNADYKFYYEVVRQGKVVHSGTEKASFTTGDDVSNRFKNGKKLIKDKEEQIIPPQKSSTSYSSSDSEDDCPAASESKYLPPIGEATIKLKVDYSLSPSFSLLVFYVREDDEVVADSMMLEVEKCFNNKVDFEFLDEVKQPGQNTTIQITTSPNSLCGIKVIDKSVTLLDNSDQLTADKVFQLIQNMDTGLYYDTNPCSSNTPQPGLSSKALIIRPPGIFPSSSYHDSLTSFLTSGYLVISDLILLTRPCGGGNNPIGPRPIFSKVAFDNAAGGIGADIVQNVITTQSAVDVRQNFPETWLFKLKMVGLDGVYTAQETLPDTITEWIGSAVCVSADDGLGISNTTSITGFQLFFISYTLPISVIRGEEFTIVVSIFNYADGALPITVSLDEPQGYVTENSIDGDICIPPAKSTSYRLKLKGTALGKINITVRAETTQNSDICGNSDVSSSFARDAITQSLDVEAEGFKVEKVQSILFCPDDEENQKFDVSYNLELPDDVVNGSARAFVDVTGNILGKSIENLNNLVDIPTGCGEQNMVKFVPNYVVLDYLSAIGELTDNIKSQAIRNLNTGYQRELNYRHRDGSFSAFGETDKQGSMFLTAFVLRSFYQAKRYITIDDSLLAAAQSWIADKQQSDGCFPNIGQIIDVGIQGGLEKDKTPTAITAYVLASLLISEDTNLTVIDSAIACLENNPPSTPYETFLVAYAEALAGDEHGAKQRLDEIKPFSRTNGGIESYTNPNGTQALDIETNSYAVLANLELGNSPQDVLGLVRYLTQNLKATGGFYSTQDTCVGLEALAGFAKLVYGDHINIDVTVTGGLNEKVEITDDNKLLVQRNRVTQVPSDLDIEATGSGCGLLQATLRYNSNTPPDKNKFYIKVVGDSVSTDCKERKISGTVSYVPSGQSAGFSVVQIKMVTGIVPDQDSIQQLPGNKKYNILRADVEANTVVLYFNEISNNGQIFEFLVQEVIEVYNPQPGTAKVFEYYAPEYSATTTYTFDCSK